MNLHMMRDTAVRSLLLLVAVMPCLGLIGLDSFFPRPIARHSTRTSTTMYNTFRSPSELQSTHGMEPLGLSQKTSITLLSRRMTTELRSSIAPGSTEAGDNEGASSVGVETRGTTTISADGKATSRGRWQTVKGYFSTPSDGVTFRQRLAKLGLAAALSYGWVSNMSYSVSVSLAWYIFSIQVCKQVLGESSKVTQASKGACSIFSLFLPARQQSRPYLFYCSNLCVWTK
jgi:hypothetical protein